MPRPKGHARRRARMNPRHCVVSSRAWGSYSSIAAGHAAACARAAAGLAPYDVGMNTPQGSRAAQYASDFEAAQRDLIAVVESLSEEQWHLVGRNWPQRLNDEDEHRSVGVIAHHVAVNTPWILDRIQRMLDGRPLPPADFQSANARHAVEHADVSRDEVLGLLREQQAGISAAVRAIPDDQLDQARDTPVGPMSIAQRLDRVLVGHIRMHLGSIQAAIR